jgi:hypothetical protein
MDRKGRVIDSVVLAVPIAPPPMKPEHTVFCSTASPRRDPLDFVPATLLLAFIKGRVTGPPTAVRRVRTNT